MFLTCLRKELLLNLSSSRYLLTFLLFIGAMVGTTAVRARIYRMQVEDYNHAHAEWFRLRTEACSTEEANTLGAVAERVPSPAAIFVGGVENEMSRSSWFRYSRSRGELDVLTGRRRLNSPGFRGFIIPDACLLVALMGSLFALVLIFDGVCGEREQGTLRLQLAGPLPRDTLLLAKIVAGLVTLAVPMMVAWVASAAYVVLQAGVTFSGDELGRLFAVAALSILFVCVFFGLGLAASAWTRRSATALGIALLGWIALALVVPNVVPVFVRHFAPVPAASKLVLERRALKDDIWAKDVPRWAQQVMEETGKKGWWDVWSGGLSRLVNEGETRAYGRLERQFHTRLKRQTELTQMVSRVSPVALFVGCASNIAGSGVADYHRYVEEVDAHRRACGEARARMHEEINQKYQRGEARWGSLVYDPHGWPEFVAAGVRLDDVLTHCWADVALLAGLAVMALLLALLGFMRYDVR